MICKPNSTAIGRTFSAKPPRRCDVVKKLAEEKGYDVVVDVSQTLYFKPALDITPDALAAYNKAYPAK
jgi:outer membrane protein